VVGSRGYVSVHETARGDQKELWEFRGQRANDWWYSRGLHLYRRLALFLSLSLSLIPLATLSHPTLSYPPVLREARERARADQLSLVGATYPPPPLSPMDVRIPPLLVLLLIVASRVRILDVTLTAISPQRYDSIERGKKGKKEKEGLNFVCAKLKWKSRLRDRDVIVATTRADVQKSTHKYPHKNIRGFSLS